jgi:CheY-like chemotaxis protein
MDILTKPVDILVIEDNPGDTRIIKEVLSSNKIFCNLHTVKDGIEAMNFLYQKKEFTEAPRPDLILLDLNLPKKDGREVLAEVKNDYNLRQIPVVVMTSSQAEEDIFRSYDLHANCYISKPLELDQFVMAVKSIEDFWFSLVRLPKKDISL